jgi:hypothetical protein
MSEQGEHVCPVAWLVDDVGRFLAGDDADEATVEALGRQAVQRGAEQVSDLLRSAFAAHEVVATEVRFTGPGRGARRTVFADQPTPVALLLLCLRLCQIGDEVQLLQHTAAKGTTTRTAIWPFGMSDAEELTRPPAHAEAPLPGLEV